MEKEKKKSKNRGKWIKRTLLIFAAVAAVLCIFCGRHWFSGAERPTRQDIQSFIESTGAVAPLVYILLSFAQVSLVPIPGAVTILAGNYLFGAVKAFLYSYVGMLLGSMVTFLLGRFVGKPFVHWLAGGQEKAESWIGRLKGREKIILFFMFLLPLFPDDLLCAIAGTLRYSTWEFFVLQLVTRATSILGTLVFMSGEIIPYSPLGISLIALLALAAVVCFVLMMKNYERISEKIENFFNKKDKK